MLPDGVKKLQEKPLYKKINFAMLGQPAFKVPRGAALVAPLAAADSKRILQDVSIMKLF